MLKIRSAAAARAAVRRMRPPPSHGSNVGTPASLHSQLNNSIHPPLASEAKAHFINGNRARDFRSSSIRLFSTCSISNCSTSVENADVDADADADAAAAEAAAAYLTMRNAAMDDAFHAIELALDSVVKIFTVASSPSYFLPWQNKSQRESMGSGFVISGRRILTNAHVVADHTFVLVRKHGSPAKYRAHVQAVGHECDLAILVVESEEFWEGMNFLDLGDVPFLQESVAVVGYPQGGDNISVTKGVVSRVEPTQYVHGATQLLAIQIDAAINPGNSGGPAIMGDKVAGVAFQNLSNAENIGYIIPVPVIKHFIAGVEETGDYVGFCSLGLSCQAIENAQLREHFKMRPGLTGVLVNRINPISDAYRVLKKDDIILSFDGVPIANDGSVSFRNRERITFDHLVSMKKPDDTAQVKVLRDGEEHEFTVTLRPLQPLVPVHQFDKLPSYFIFAGLVFVPLTQPYLHEYGEDWYNTSPRRLCERALKELPQKDGQQLVILSQVLVDDINTGYERLAEFQVKKVNGVEVDNLKHLRQLVEDGSRENIRFDLDDERVIVLNYDKARIATSRILKRHRIPSATSADLIVDEQQTVSDIQLPSSMYTKPLADLQKLLDTGRSLGRPEGVIINGKGGKGDGKDEPMFTMAADKTYRYRFCNVGMKNSVNVRFQKHTMKLVEVEGSHTVQNTYDSLDVHLGQCYAVLVTANQAPGDYYLIASTRFTKEVLTTTATVRYAGGKAAPPPAEMPEPPVGWAWSLNQFRSQRWNLTASAARPNPQGSYHYGEINITRTIKIVNTAGAVDGKLRYAINGVSHVNPETPLKLAEYFRVVDKVFKYDLIKDDPGEVGDKITMAPNVVNTTYRNYVEIIFENPEKSVQSWHLAGYSFFAVAIEPGKWTPAKRSNYNLLDAVSRNTIQVYPGCWAAIMTTMDNAGLWNLRAGSTERAYLGQQLYLSVLSPELSLRDEYNLPDDQLLCGIVKDMPRPKLYTM